jgi:hypothetical protein
MVFSTHKKNSNLESTIDLGKLIINYEPTVFYSIRFPLPEGAMSRVTCKIISRTTHNKLNMEIL